jgi:ribosomal-protein-alanine N-acetyltransferase
MSTSAVTLFEGGIADLDAVMKVMDESFDPRFGEAWTASQCAGLLPMPGVWLSLARDTNGIAGFSLARAIADEAELLLLAVSAEAQGRGLGTMLLARFCALAKARGASRLHLEVREGNHAVNLYNRAGFGVIGRRRNYYSGPDGRTYDALTLGMTATYVA